MLEIGIRKHSRKIKHLIVISLILVCLISLTLQAKDKVKKKSKTWSVDLGYIDKWYVAKKRCIFMKMRLPTQNELMAAYYAGITKSWASNSDDWYWTSTANGQFFFLEGGFMTFNYKGNYGHLRYIIRIAIPD